MPQEKIKTYCRFCHAYCPMVATVKDNELLALEPDPDNPVYGGYTCVKGRQLIEQVKHPTRVEQSQKKQADGSFKDIASADALDEIADKLKDILAKHGPRAIASYNGTYSFQNSAAHDVARAFHAAIDSPSYYTSVTIDQPAKVAIGPARMGFWNGGGHMWNDSDVALIIGNNTLVSHYSIPGGVPSFSPHNALREGRKRGMKIICIDPRRTEVASRADLHLQVNPGHDAAVLASMISVILREELHDAEFCKEHVDNLEALEALTNRFTPQRVAEAAGITAGQIMVAARTFAKAKRGTAVSGTGPEMGPHPNLLQHLIQSINAICGRYCRAGEKMPNPGVLTPPVPRRAQATGPVKEWLDDGIRSRVSDDIRETVVLSPYGPKKEMPTAIIADEMLMEGEGQIKALICVGGNPLLAFPDQEKTHRALESLELLVCVDLKMSATAQMADYVLAPKLCLEREDVTLLTDIWHDVPYCQYTPKVIDAEGDKIEEWEAFWELGKRMGLSLEMAGGPIDMQNKPSKYELLSLITQGSRVPLEDIRAREGGNIYEVPDIIVQPADPETAQRLELTPDGLSDELDSAFNDLDAIVSDDFPLRLISRRMKNTYNSTGPELPLLGKKGTTNPAYMNPRELTDRGISDGEVIEVTSVHGAIPAVAAAAADIKPGVVSMSHCWGGSPDPAQGVDGKVREIGSNTNRLIDNLTGGEKYSGMPRQSCIPVAVRKLS